MHESPECERPPPKRGVKVSGLLLIFSLFLASILAYAATITVNQPPIITNNRTPLLNVTFNETVNQTWFSIDNGANTTACYNCTNFTTILNQEFPQNTTGLVGWWKFNEGSGSSTTADSSGNGNTGTLTNMNTTGNATSGWTSSGKFGKALQFDGVDDYVDAGNRASLNITNAITIEAWVKVNSHPNTNRWLVGKTGGDLLSIVYGFRSNWGDGYRAVISVGGTLRYGAVFPLGYDWNHIVMTYDGKTLSTYKNGALWEANSAPSGNIDSNPSQSVFIESPSGDGWFNGTIDEVRIWNRALSQQEIQTSYDAAKYPLYRRINYPQNSNSSYSCTAFAQNNAGNVNQTETRTFNIVNDNHTYFLTATGPAIKNTKVLPNTTLFSLFNDAKYSSSNNLSLQASRGEYEPASFVIMSNPDLAGINITASALSHGQDIISASNVDIRAVKVWWQAGTNVWDAQYNLNVLSPELLLHDDALVIVNGTYNFIKGYNCSGCYINISNPQWPLKYSNVTAYNAAEAYLTANVKPNDSSTLLPLNISANTLKQFWITIHVPDSAVAGVYKGTINITYPNGTSSLQSKLINLQVEVLPFTLENSSLDYSIYYRGTLSADNTPTISSEGKSAEQMGQEMRDMKAHGIDNPNIYQGLSNLSDYLTIRADKGFKKDKIYHLGANSVSYTGNLAAYNNTIFPFINLSRAFGYGDVYFYAVDEASGAALTAERPAFNATHVLGAKNFVSCYEADCFTLVGDLLDTAVLATLSTTVASQFHSVGNKIYSYANPQLGVEQPETYRRNYGGVLWKAGYDGAMDYAYQHSFGFGWNDYDDPFNRDHIMAYPTMNGVIDTIQWEGFREGVDDTRYLATLQKYINLSKSGNATAVSAGIQAESWLNSTDFTNGDLDQIRSGMISQIKNMYYALQDTTAPTVSLSLSANPVYQGYVITISCSASDNYQVSSTSLTITKPNGDRVTATCNQPFTDTSATGAYTVTYTATDTSGNTASTSQAFTVNSYGGGSIVAQSKPAANQTWANATVVSPAIENRTDAAATPQEPEIKIRAHEKINEVKAKAISAESLAKLSEAEAAYASGDYSRAYSLAVEAEGGALIGAVEVQKEPESQRRYVAYVIAIIILAVAAYALSANAKRESREVPAGSVHPVEQEMPKKPVIGGRYYIQKRAKDDDIDDILERLEEIRKKLEK